MTEEENGAKLPVTLAERVARYRIEVERIVGLGIEHPQFELKRSVTIRKEDIADRLDFIKLIQGLPTHTRHKSASSSSVRIKKQRGSAM